MSGGRYSRPHGREYGLHDSLITKEIVRQACPCVSNHVPDTNFPLKNLDGPSQGVRDSNPLNSNKWFPPASASPTTRFILALPRLKPVFKFVRRARRMWLCPFMHRQRLVPRLV